MSRDRALIVFLGLLILTACAPGLAPSGADAGEALRERERTFLAALAARDLDRTTALFADHAELHIANMPLVQGSDAIERFYGNVFRFMEASAAEPQTMRVAASGDMAYTTGRVRNRFDSGPDAAAEYEGKYLIVWERVGGEWMIVIYGISNDSGVTAAPRMGG